jgi:outer membrane protein OmpA-like peptidoglycan-associated protein
VALAVASLLAGCSNSAVKDGLKITQPYPEEGSGLTSQSNQDRAVTADWVGKYGEMTNHNWDFHKKASDILQQLRASGRPIDKYSEAKSQCWLDAAREELDYRNGWGFVHEAIGESNKINGKMSAGQADAFGIPPLRTQLRVRPDLWTRAQAISSKVTRRCPEVAAALACSEVNLAHAGHLAWTTDYDAAQKKVDLAMGGLSKAESGLDSCNEPPPPSPPPLTRVELSADALFRFDRSDVPNMLPEGRAKLDAFAAQLGQIKGVTGLKVTGHTDRLGSDSYNDALSLKRANTVKAYLQSKGVTVPITAAGAGERQPVKECPDGPQQQLRDCLQPNRRVTVDIGY